MKKIKEYIIRLLQGKKKEYVYFFCLDSATFDEKKMKGDELLRQILINNISKDLERNKKEIKFTDFLTDTKEYKTYYMFASDSVKTNPHLMPIFLQIYAYKSKKSEEIFSYPIEKLIFKNHDMEVVTYKFEITC